jgi:hypothetical protein
VVKYYYPSGTESALSPPSGERSATVYRVPASEIMARYGVTATLTSGDGVVWEGKVPTVGALPGGVAVSQPLTATWSGAFYSKTAEPVKLWVEGNPTAKVWALDVQMLPDRPAQIDAGWSPFHVTAQITGTSPLKLMLQAGTQAAAEVDTAHLWPMPADSGLTALLNGAAAPVRRLDPFLGSGMLFPRTDAFLAGDLPAKQATATLETLPMGLVAGGGQIIKWQGELYAEGGDYLMELRTDANVQLTIDDKMVVNLCDNPASKSTETHPPPATTTVHLDPGWHKVRVVYQASGQSNGLELMWTRPDGVREVVPPSRLRPLHTGAGPDAPVRWPATPDPVSCGP